MVKRVTVNIDMPDDLRTRLSAEAETRGMTLEDLVLQRLQGAPPEDATPRREFRSAGAGRSGRTDISVRAREILRAEWGGT
jgi:hypothetical protein